MKQIRLSKANEQKVAELIKDSGEQLLTMPKAANLAIEKGLPALRKKYVKGKNHV